MKRACLLTLLVAIGCSDAPREGPDPGSVPLATRSLDDVDWPRGPTVPARPGPPSGLVRPDHVIADDGRDDAPALQAVLDDAAAIPGTTVLLSAGRYDLGTPLDVPSATTLAGQGAATVLVPLQPMSAVVQTTAGATDVTVRDLRVTGARSPEPDRGGTCLELRGTRRFLVERLTVDDCEKYGLWANAGSANGTFRRNAVDASMVGIETTASHDIWIVENRIALVAGRAFSGVHPLDFSERIAVVGNTITGADAVGVHVVNAADVTLVDNQVELTGASGHGIVFDVNGLGPSRRGHVETGTYRSAGGIALFVNACPDCTIGTPTLLSEPPLVVRP